MLAVFFIMLTFFSALLQAAPLKPDDCFECHDAFKKFNHGSASCVDCHKDVTEVPHKEKLEKPLCLNCHNETVASYTKSIHSTQGISCRECHTTHYLGKDKKNCLSCHGLVAHRALPSREKHLQNLGCAVCHGKPVKRKIEAELLVHVAKGTPLQKTVIDRDGNNLIDKVEWDFFLKDLREKYKGSFTVQRSYIARTDVHDIAKRPVPCGACHTERTMVKEPSLKVSGISSYTFRLAPGLLIPELSAIEGFKKTVHGKKGVACGDCHTSQRQIDDKTCIQCHREIYSVYKNTAHAKGGATKCTDCHDPHKTITYREYNARQRIEVCARCHKDYPEKHAWLPNSLLHFNYLECATCHSPESTKSIVFFFGQQGEKTKEALPYEAFKNAYGKGFDARDLIDTNKDKALVSQEIADFFLELRRKFKENLYIGASIIVTNAYHDYSMKRSKERVCTTCHSERAPFYDSMYLMVPEEVGSAYIPIKGTILSAAPIAVFTDLCLLGEEKVTMADIRQLLNPGEKGLSEHARTLGFKWIDIVGIAFMGLIVLFVIFHIIARIFLK